MTNGVPPWSDWNKEFTTVLRTLWAEGHSAAAIGRCMRISKNAVIGKAHRLGLPARPSPIRRGVPALTRPTKPRHGPQPLSSEPAVVAAPPPAPVAPMRAPPAPPVSVRATSTRELAHPCFWPIGDVGEPDFHFCDEPAVTGRPYCKAHMQTAYVRVMTPGRMDGGQRRDP